MKDNTVLKAGELGMILHKRPSILLGLNKVFDERVCFDFDYAILAEIMKIRGSKEK